ncbi:gastrula zinc finger protein XlCGF57.1 [Agrilus planipennis]|uniref:Gastrula zinc finger protein XlCGF57.1 n=1 Tax=Agrilus planipennis TaxID=224129 RepID=A0A1W4XD80_AGRPL|nr:gastrula zinc finger protein XlCGF57.1 [Agrilus planipennis]
METLCRLCALPQEDLITVLEEMDTRSKILHLLQVNINSEDHLPVAVCCACRNNVLNMWEFHQQVQHAQQFLNEHLNKQETFDKKNAPCSKTVSKQDLYPPTSVNSTVIVNEAITNINSQTVFNNTISTIKISKTNKGRKVIPKKKNNRKDLFSVDILDVREAEWHEDGSVTFPNGTVDGWDAYPWSCSECDEQMPNSYELKQHFLSHHSRPVHYRCVDCPKIYTKLSPFAAHVRAHRQSLRFCCETCMKWFGTTAALDQHRNAAHCDGRPLSCTTCGKRFRVQSSLATHLRSHLPAELKNRHQCDQCPKKFGTRPNLLAHRRIHTGVRDYTCDQCGKSFVQKGNLDNHMLTHSAVRPFSCIICGKTFKTSVRLKKHSLVHSGAKPYQCEECGRQFREKGTLREHLRIHTGAMPYSCEFCGKAFRFKGILTTHRRQHTGERPYSCLECQHHFTNWPNYNKHMKRRHGINTSVTVRKPQNIPPTGMPQKNPPGTVLASPHFSTAEPPQTNLAEVAAVQQFYPTAVLNIYNLPEEMLQQRI